jgi:uncharacterized membrane protein YeaQ/YmgE (transglycosylase-associated protein family)
MEKTPPHDMTSGRKTHVEAGGVAQSAARSSAESRTGVARPIRTTPFKDGLVDLLTWCIVGLVAGVLASLVMGGTGYGIIGDIIIGIVGAFVGGWIFRTLGIASPISGIGGTILVAFIGAVVLLFILRLIRGATRRAP